MPAADFKPVPEHLFMEAVGDWQKRGILEDLAWKRFRHWTLLRQGRVTLNESYHGFLEYQRERQSECSLQEDGSEALCDYV